MTNREIAKAEWMDMTPKQREVRLLAFNLPVKWALARWEQIPNDVQRGFTKQLIKAIT